MLPILRSTCCHFLIKSWRPWHSETWLRRLLVRTAGACNWASHDSSRTQFCRFSSGPCWFVSIQNGQREQNIFLFCAASASTHPFLWWSSYRARKRCSEGDSWQKTGGVRVCFVQIPCATLTLSPRALIRLLSADCPIFRVIIFMFDWNLRGKFLNILGPVPIYWFSAIQCLATLNWPRHMSHVVSYRFIAFMNGALYLVITSLNYLVSVYFCIEESHVSVSCRSTRTQLHALFLDSCTFRRHWCRQVCFPKQHARATVVVLEDACRSSYF